MKTILIVDDKTENLYLLQSVLQGYGFAVTTAENGAEALDLARKNAPDLVIADILMPVMDGFTLCREWKRDPVLARIPFVFYTATYIDEKDERFALSLGADLFMVKPAEPSVIVENIGRVLKSAVVHDAPAGGETEHPEINYLQEYNAALIRKLEDKAEDLERANAELRALDMMKDNLLRNVTHEFLTPLTVIRGYAELLETGRSGPVTDQQKAHCIAIANCTHRLLHMINNLIFFSDPATWEMDRDITNVQVAELLATVRDAIIPRANEKEIEVVIEPTAVVLHGDRHEYLQMFFNLLENAVKFTPARGRVTVSTEAIGGIVRVSVRDTGIGIASEEQQRIFERFYQVDSSTTRQAGGLGLGLGIVREIVGRHGGRIELVSKLGAGSTFTAVLPRTEKEAARA